jgi:hypothetical protein
MAAPEEIPVALKAWSAGDRAALDRLMPKLYQELHRIARRHAEKERAAIRCKRRPS